MVKVRREMRWHILDRIIKQRGYTMGAELGVFAGRNLKYLLISNPKLYMVGVDTWEPNHEAEALRAIGGRSYADAGLEDMFATLLKDLDREKLMDRCVLQRLHTIEAVKLWPDETFDFVFVDADHTYEGVWRDIDDWLPKIRQGGMIAGHDYNHRDFPGVVRAVDEKLRNVHLEPDHVWRADV